MKGMKAEKSDQTDEGYDEQRFEEPDFMKDWTDERKAEFAYQLLLCIPISKTIKVVDRLSPLLNKDYISSLPNEVAIQILFYLDITSICYIARVSKRWKSLTEDQSLWKSLFYSAGWTANQSSIQRYLSDITQQNTFVLPKRLYGSTSASHISSIPLARTTANLYDPNALPKMPGAPISSTSTTRLKPFKRSTDLIIDKLLSRSNNSNDSNTSNNNNSSSSSGTSTSSSSTSTCNSINPENETLEGNTSIVIRPTQISRSQPILQQRYKQKREVISHTIVERPFANRPLPRKNVKYDEAAFYHYKELHDIRFINWKRLYRNRHLIDKRWQEGKYKLRQFPSADYTATEDVQPNSGIYCLQFNAHMLVTGSRDKNINMWDIKTGRLRYTLEGHRGSVLCLHFDRRYLLSGSSDSTLILWDLQTGKKIKKLVGHRESVLNVKFVDNTVVSCSKDRTVRTWDLEKGTCQMTFNGHRAAVNAVQFKGDRIVSASGDRTIKIWDMNTGECLNTLDSHSRGIACVEYDGQYIVSGSSDQTIKIWNAFTGECLHTLVGHRDLVRTLQIDSQSKTIVSGSYDGSLKIWKLDDGKLIRTLTQTSHGRILNLQFDFSKIICCSNLGKIDMYDFTHGMDTQFLL